MKRKGAAIGTFDGLHLGHRSVLELLKTESQERGLDPIAITFDRHPLELIAPERVPPQLTTVGKRKKLLRETGVEPVVLMFDEDLRKTSAEEWMKRMRDEFGVGLLVIGYDNTFGHDGVNLSVGDYKEMGKKSDIEVIVANELKDISSSAIRKAVKNGEMERSHEMLGRPYSITGRVVEGQSLGRALGFPTANIAIDPKIAIPKDGVYAAIVKINDGSNHPAMVNIGVRPTLGRSSERVIEVHILDWQGDLYGKEITVRFLKRLRDEKRFDSIDELKRQLSIDREEVLGVVES